MLLFALFSCATAAKLMTQINGVPYLNNAEVKVANNRLVFNDDHAKEASMSYDNGVLYVGHEQRQVVVDKKTNALQVTAPANGLLAPMWSKTDGVVHVDNQTLAWACPYDKSGIYYLYWSKKQMKKCYGGHEIDLVLVK